MPGGILTLARRRRIHDLQRLLRLVPAQEEPRQDETHVEQPGPHPERAPQRLHRLLAVAQGGMGEPQRHEHRNALRGGLRGRLQQLQPFLGTASHQGTHPPRIERLGIPGRRPGQDLQIPVRILEPAETQQHQHALHTCPVVRRVQLQRPVERGERGIEPPAHALGDPEHDGGELGRLVTDLPEGQGAQGLERRVILPARLIEACPGET